jgi:selenoprotein W-related protein
MCNSHVCLLAIFVLITITLASSFTIMKTPAFFARSTELNAKPVVSIEYCTGCKWLLRSAWLAQELLTTFEKDLDSVSLKPNSDSPGGVFTVRIDGKEIWDRRNEETKGFPEAKILKQLIRDEINPQMSLGHSDSKVIELPTE